MMAASKISVNYSAVELLHNDNKKTNSISGEHCNHNG